MKHHIQTTGLCLLCACSAQAQSNISGAHRYAWQENCGWTNWRDANGGSQGVRVHATYLEGYIWTEGSGWINTGDGSPGGGGGYTNTSGADTGVNILPGGDLSGYGWGENVGWINFNTAASLGSQRARFDAATGRFYGYAWGENIGWVNLNDAAAYVGITTTCYANCDGSVVSPQLTANDFQCFLNAFAAASSYANCDGSTVVPTLTANDFQCFLNAFAAGCS